MNIRSHGAWELYRPDRPPPGAPANTLFARRNDGSDWYDYIRDGDHFWPTSVKMTVIDGVVGAAAFEADRLFPAGATVLEVSGAQVFDPQAAFGGKLYDTQTRTFSEPPERETPPNRVEELERHVEQLTRRIEVLEAGGP